MNSRFEQEKNALLQQLNQEKQRVKELEVQSIAQISTTKKQLNIIEMEKERLLLEVSGIVKDLTGYPHS